MIQMMKWKVLMTKTLHRWNSKYDNNFSVHNNVDVMMNESWNHSGSDEGKSFNPLDHNA